MSRSPVIETISSILTKEKDQVLAMRPGWESVFVGFPSSGPLAAESLDSFLGEYARDNNSGGGTDAFLRDESYGVCETKEIIALHTFLFSVKKPRDIDRNLVVHEVIDYLFEEYKLRYYMSARFDEPILQLIRTGKLSLPPLYFYVAVAHSLPENSTHELLHITNYFIKIYNEKTNSEIEPIHNNDVNKLSFQYKLRSMTIDNIFLGVYVILSILDKNMENRMYDALHEFRKILVDIYFFKNAI